MLWAICAPSWTLPGVATLMHVRGIHAAMPRPIDQNTPSSNMLSS